MSGTEKNNASDDNNNSPNKNEQTDGNDNKPIETGVNQEKDKYVKYKIGGKYATPIDTSPISSDLQIGNLQIDDSKQLKKYVYVPAGFDFKTYEGIKQLFEVLAGIDEPDIVFSIPHNYSVVPSPNIKTMKKWWEELAQKQASSEEASAGKDDARSAENTPKSPSLAFNVRNLGSGYVFDTKYPSTPSTDACSSIGSPTRSFVDEEKYTETKVSDERLLREKICREDVHNIFSAIAVFQNALMLISNPFVGNELATIALDAVKQERQSTVQSIGLFHTGDEDVLDGRLTVLKEPEDTKYDKEIIGKIEELRKNKSWAKSCAFKDEEGVTRMPVPDELFRLYSVPVNNTALQAIKVDCKLTKDEKRNKKKRKVRIPGALANKCDHCLIFTSKKRMFEFEKVFCDLRTTCTFACGGSHRQLKAAKEALFSGRPLFAIEGTGFVPTVVDHFYKSSCASSDTYRRIENQIEKERELEKISKGLSDRLIGNKGLMKKNNKQRGGEHIDEYEYEYALRKLVNSLDARIYEIDEDSILKTFNQSSVVDKQSNKSDIAKFENKKLKIKETVRDIISLPAMNALYSEAQFFKFCDNQSENSDDNYGEVLIEEMSLKEIFHPDTEGIFFQIFDRHDKNGKTIGKEGGNHRKTFGKEEENIGNAVDEEGGNHVKTLDNKEGKRLLLVEVPRVQMDASRTKIPNREDFLRTKKISSLVGNFMNNPREELDINDFVNNAAKNIPIVEVDCDCKIFQINKAAERMYTGHIKEKQNLSDLIKAKLAKATDKAKLEYAEQEIDKFIRIALSPEARIDLPSSTLMHIDLEIETTDESCFKEDHRGRFMMSIKAVPRFDRREKDVILGSFFLFQDNTITKPWLKTPKPDNEDVLRLGEVLINSEGSAINKFNENAYYLIKSKSDSLEVKDKISKVLHTASDWSSELHGDERNKQAIEECNELIEEGKRARFRYRNFAVFFHFFFQILVLLTTSLTAFKVQCEGERQILFCDRCPSPDNKTAFPVHFEIENTETQTLLCDRNPLPENAIAFEVYCAGENTATPRLWCDQDPSPDNTTAFKGHCEGEIAEQKFGCGWYPSKDNRQYINLLIVIAPIIAVAIQSMVYAFRPKWKSARLSLMQNTLESEMFKFRARIGQYDAFDSKRKGTHDSVREKFVENCKKHFESCIDADFQNGTIYARWGTYERRIEPLWVKIKRGLARVFSKMKGCYPALKLALKSMRIKLCYRKEREALLHDLLQSKLKKNRTDIEAQGTISIDTQDERAHGALINMTSELQRLTDHLQDAEEQRARNDEMRRKTKKDKEMYCVLNLDGYKKIRLEPQFHNFKTHLPWLIFCRNTLQILIILFTALSTFLAAFSIQGQRQLVFLIPISLAFRSFFQDTLAFYQLETRIPILHKHCVSGLKKALLAMNSPSTIERNLPTEKGKIISEVEMSILTYYFFMAEDQLENGKDNQGDHKYDGNVMDDEKEEKKFRKKIGENTQDGISNTSHANLKTE